MATGNCKAAVTVHLKPLLRVEGYPVNLKVFILHEASRQIKAGAVLAVILSVILYA
jgi:hypothetical protein